MQPAAIDYAGVTWALSASALAGLLDSSMKPITCAFPRTFSRFALTLLRIHVLTMSSMPSLALCWLRRNVTDARNREYLRSRTIDSTDVLDPSGRNFRVEPSQVLRVSGGCARLACMFWNLAIGLPFLGRTRTGMFKTRLFVLVPTAIYFLCPLLNSWYMNELHCEIAYRH